MIRLLVAGLAALTAAFDRGDLDEAARQGALAGPVVVERALGSASRRVRLAAIVAAGAVEDRAELLPALARLAGGPDRRTAIPAGHAALAIARELAAHELADDLAPDDLATWRAGFEAIARGRDRFVEVRVLALDTAAALAHMLDPEALGFDLGVFLDDPDPAVRGVAVALVPRPAPAASRARLATAIAGDPDPQVALAAAAALCGDGDATLDAAAVARLRALHPSGGAARCLR